MKLCTRIRVDEVELGEITKFELLDVSFVDDDHEFFDGGSYPAGSVLHIEGRIEAVAMEQR